MIADYTFQTLTKHLLFMTNISQGNWPLHEGADKVTAPSAVMQL